MAELKPGTALIVIDVQQGFCDASWGQRNNPDCEANIERLLVSWRERRWPVVFVRHDSRLSHSPLSPGQPGNAFKPMVNGEPDLLVTKHVNSAFYGDPDLHAWLRKQEIRGLAICGITTNHCCETTARMAGNLGYDTWFVLDATHTFSRADLDGSWISGDELARTTAANLDGEFATVVQTESLLGAVAGLAPAVSDPLTGGCGCGAVRYEITKPLTRAGYCHCTRCQRRSGTAASASGRVAPGSFRVVSGESRLRAWRPEDGWEKWFCGECGSALFSRSRNDPDQLAVRLGSLDGDPRIRPAYRQFVAYAAAWEALPDDGLPRHPESR